MNKKIKVAHVLHSVGGVDVYLRLVTENTDSNRINHVIINQNDPQKLSYLNNGVRLKEYYIPITREINLFKDLKAVWLTIKYLKKEKPDVIHAHSSKGGIIARIAALFYNVKVLYTPHAFSYLSATSSTKRFVYLKIEQLFKNFNSIVLATSKSERNRAIQDVNYKKYKTVVFNNAILPINEYNIDSSIIDRLQLPEKYICTVGRPSYQKNIEFMIDVLFMLKTEIPEIHLVIMGVGEYSPNLETVKDKIKLLNLRSNITLVNWIERKSIFSIIDKSILYISTSRYEGLPYSIIESLALSKACVVTNCDGNIDLINDDYNGYVVNQNDLIQFYSKTKKVFLNEELRKKFEKNSKILFEEKFNLKKNISKLERIYQKYGDIQNKRISF